MEESKSWSTTTRYIILILILGGFLWLVISARDLIGPLAVSALLAYVINPIIIWVNRHTRISRRWVVLLVYLVVLAALVVAGILIAPLIPLQINNLASQMEIITEQVQSVIDTPITILNIDIPLGVILATWPQFTQDFTRPDLLINALAATSQNLVWILIVVVVTYYLLLDWLRLREWLLKLVPPDYRGDAERLYREVRRVWSQYSRGTLRLMLVIGLLTGIVSAAIGLPGAYAFGVLAGLLDIVLTVGPIIVTIIAAIVAFVAGSTWLPISNFWFMILVILLFSGIQLVENVWLRPRIMGGQLRLHPAVVFVAVVGTLAMAGILTALIIVPLLGSALVIGRYLYYKISDLEPWTKERNQQSTANDP
ncbi:MAG: AI-2E family transporter [Candidatus Promineifilaceae bacterium]|nr:AI-2E family transporter [Candidatus Promineifilaceae bacterium]